VRKDLTPTALLDVGKKTSELGFVGLKDCSIKVKTDDGQGFES
jgi:hypothetical protein